MELTLEFGNAGSLSVRQMEQAAQDIRKKMMRLAYMALSPETAAIYTSALTSVVIHGTEASFRLEGWLATAIESGVDPFDMKPGMLASPKAKVSKTGNRYLNVPIREAQQTVVIRTVSSKSKPGSWIHPGLLPYNFWEKAKIEWSKG